MKITSLPIGIVALVTEVAGSVNPTFSVILSVFCGPSLYSFS